MSDFKPSRRRVLILGSGLGAVAAAWYGFWSRDSRGEPDGSWEVAPSMSLAVQEIYPAWFDGAIHVAGGITSVIGSEVVATDRHNVFDPVVQTWSVATALPRPRHHIQLIGHGGRLFALGGFAIEPGVGSWVMQDQTWVYDPDTALWSDARAVPEPHAETVCAAIGDRVHLVGGRVPRGPANAAIGDHRDSRRHWVYDPVADRWERAAPPPSARNSAAGAVIDGLWYVVGGRSVTHGNLASNEVYDPREDRWRQAEPMPLAQAGLAAAAIDGDLVAFGGEGRDGVFAEVWRYDPGADSWTAMAPMPLPRHGLGAVTVDGSVYLLGGAAGRRAVATSARVDRFRLEGTSGL